MFTIVSDLCACFPAPKASRTPREAEVRAREKGRGEGSRAYASGAGNAPCVPPEATEGGGKPKRG